MSLTIPLPLPPSANALFKTLPNGRRARTAVYDRWLEEAGYHARLAARSGGVPLPPLRLTIALGIRDRNRDASNCIKPIEDMLVKSIPGFPDDRWNDDVRARRDSVVPPGTALVTIESLAPG